LLFERGHERAYETIQPGEQSKAGASRTEKRVFEEIVLSSGITKKLGKELERRNGDLSP